MNRKRRRRTARQLRVVLGADADIRYVIPTSTGHPNRNWLVAVTRDDFLVCSLDWLGRPKSLFTRAPRTPLHPRITPTRKRVVYIGSVAHYVPIHHLNEVELQNRELDELRR